MISDALMKKYNVEMAGGRHVAVVDGKKQYLTNVGADGKVFVNELGLRLEGELEEAAPEPTTAPTTKAKREKKAAAVEELQLDL